ncbi:MAG TPA: metallophosphoesterase family protein [Sphingobium sp.]|nr:metallophosphoesterase family protein [Sphingobium sp.]
MFRFFRPKSPPAPLFVPNVGPDRRVYAIGDIHGRLDLFDRLLQLIGEDDAGRSPLPCHLILLGDLMDRGPQSAAVIERAMALAGASPNVHLIKGNHEEVFVGAARGSPQFAAYCRRIGGIAALESYGLEPGVGAAMTDGDMASWMLRQVPRDHIDFLDGFEDSLIMGDYLFVHAGIRPGLPLEEQEAADLRWIRGEFLHDRQLHPYMIVHGHSITEEVDEQANRIGIDTGAWKSGKLTAIGLQGTERWFLQT